MFANLLNLTISSWRLEIIKWLQWEDNLFNSMLLNMILTVFIGLLVSLPNTSYCEKFVKCDKNVLVESYCCKTNTIELEGFVYKKNRWESYTEFSNKFKSILFYISNLDYNSYNIHSIKELLHSDIQIDGSVSNNPNETNRSQYIISQSGYFKLNNNIYAYISKTNVQNDNEKTSIEEINKYKLKISSKTLGLKQIETFITKCEKVWDNEKITKKQYFLTIKSTLNKKLTWNKFLYNSNRTFENMYLGNKGYILDKINFFINNKQYYIDKGIPYTMGLLFYGKPGTGKTSFIKALTNKLKRHIVEIPFKKIQTCEQLYEAFYLESHDNLNLEFKNKIIVLEDIDAMSEIIKKRTIHTMKNPISNEEVDNEEPGEEVSKGEDYTHIINELICSMKTTKNIDSKLIQTKIKDISLSFILNLFEGLLEMDGRIIIMTTNHIDSIDPALIRPGRIDEKICFELLDSENINNMLKFYIPEWKPINLDKLVLSQAEIMNIIIMNEDNIRKIKSSLVKLSNKSSNIN